MKKLVVAAIIVANVFLACKKEDRTCSCTVTRTGTSTTTAALSFSVPIIGNVPVIDTSFVAQVNEVKVVDQTLTKVTKKQAKYSCISYKQPYKHTILNSAPPLMLSTTEEGTETYDCKLK